ncbi:hypothetical protein GC169_11790 [bacterium]|nr:hypothetical protein [bacterium]
MRTTMFALALAALTPGAAFAQAAGYEVPRTIWGTPDLGGYWTNGSLTSLERSPQFSGLVISEAEAARIEGQRAAFSQAQDRPSDPNAPAPPRGQDVGGYNAFWTDPGTRFGTVKGEIRSSWIVEPANGRIPYTPEGRKKFESELAKRRTTFDGPEMRPTAERCLVGFGSTGGPPMINVLYNNHYQIVQGPDSVMILVEMNHDARIIRMESEHQPLSRWLGDSVGRWEGDTLVVETTNFHPDEALRPYFSATFWVSPDAKVTERFTRWSDDQILYEFSVDDPKMLERPWHAEMSLNRSDEQVFEYACHEGNYSLPGILAGARKDEREGRTTVADLTE